MQLRQRVCVQVYARPSLPEYIPWKSIIIMKRSRNVPTEELRHDIFRRIPEVRRYSVQVNDTRII